jgi:uncharacterized protein (TIGR02594 family)
MALGDDDLGLFGSLLGGVAQPMGPMIGAGTRPLAGMPLGVDMEELRRKLMERLQAKQGGAPATAGAMPPPDAPAHQFDFTGQAPPDQVAGLQDGRRAMDALSGLRGASTTSPQGSAMIQKYLKDGGVGLNPQQLAWCAAAVNSSMVQAGVKGTGSNMAKSFLNWGSPVDTPSPGDVAVFSRGDPNGPLGHVGFYNGTDESGNIRVLGGNQGKSVKESSFPASQLLAYRRAPGATSDPIASVLAQNKQPGSLPNVAASDMPSSKGSNMASFGSLAPDLPDPDAAQTDLSISGTPGAQASAKQAGPLSNALGLGDNARNILQALAFSMLSSKDRRTPFADLPQFLMMMSKQKNDAANLAFNRNWQQQQADRTQKNADRSYDFQVQSHKDAQDQQQRGLDRRTFRVRRRRWGQTPRPPRLAACLQAPSVQIRRLQLQASVRRPFRVRLLPATTRRRCSHPV